MIGVNDNQTLAQFKANEAPLPSPAPITGAVRQVRIFKPEDGLFMVVEFGFVPGMFGPRFQPTKLLAAEPHPHCPENKLAGLIPAGMVRCAPPAKAKVQRPSYLRVVA